ncbi:MAG: PRC-barrel domain-containing protein [Anaerolineae bacterium]|jgi:uncharacterized protein YrrD
MQFKAGANVFTADGEKVGTIDRVVLDPDTKEATHLVIQKGFLFAENKVVPMSLVGPATEDRVTLREDANDLGELPEFEVAHYVPAEPETQPAPDDADWASPVYHYPPFGAWWTTMPQGGYAVPPYVAKIEKNIPEGTVALKEGAKVVDREGKHIGDVERIFTDSLEDRATHLLISEGLLFKEKKLVPTSWLLNVFEDEVRLSVEADVVDNLPEYQVQG